MLGIQGAVSKLICAGKFEGLSALDYMYVRDE